MSTHSFRARQKRTVETLLESSRQMRQASHGAAFHEDGPLLDKISVLLASCAYQVQGVTHSVINPDSAKSLLSQAAFSLESIAHLQGHEALLLPFSIHLRQAEDKLKELRNKFTAFPEIQSALNEVLR